jgi:hypothetical protein
MVAHLNGVWSFAAQLHTDRLPASAI